MLFKHNNAHIFDCDGVLLDSNSLKLNALRIALESQDLCGDFINWAIGEFKDNFGRTRLEHFEVFLKSKMNKNKMFDEVKMQKAIKKYSTEVVSLYRECSPIPEAKSFIEKLSQKSKILVVSASDQSELKKVLPEKYENLSSDRIFGGPTSKVLNIKRIIDKNKFRKIYFYGDSVQDAKAAIKNKIKFIGISDYSANKKKLFEFCNAHGLDIYNNFNEISHERV